MTKKYFDLISYVVVKSPAAAVISTFDMFTFAIIVVNIYIKSKNKNYIQNIFRQRRATRSARRYGVIVRSSSQGYWRK